MGNESKITIFGLQMLMKSGLEKIISNPSMRKVNFPYFLKGKISVQNDKFSAIVSQKLHVLSMEGFQ